MSTHYNPVSITKRQYLIAHVSNAQDNSTVYRVYYSPQLNCSVDTNFAPFVQNGIPVEVSPYNTPITLHLQGTYRFIQQNADTEALLHLEQVERDVVMGHVVMSNVQ